MALRRVIAREVRRHRPDVVLTNNFRPTWDGATLLNQPDHMVTGQATLDAVRDAANRWVFADLADEAGGLHLLGLADGAALVRLHAVDAGLAAGDHHVADLLALPGPAGDGCGGAELHVVGVGHDAQGAVPVLVQWGQRRRGIAHAVEHRVERLT